MTTLALSDMAKALAAGRPQTRKVCPMCGTEFIGISTQLFDKPRCRRAAYRQRQAEARTRPAEQIELKEKGTVPYYEDARHPGEFIIRFKRLGATAT